MREKTTLEEMDKAHLWHPYTRKSSADQGLPIIVRGEGPYLYDIDDNAYFDAISSWWCCALGHSQPDMVHAIQEQAGRLQHSILGNLSHEPGIRLAGALAELMPDNRRHTHFCSDGASAIEAALKMSVQYAWQRGEQDRTVFLSLREAYHGDTLATLSLGFIDLFHKPFGRVRMPCQQLPVPPYDMAPDDCDAEMDRIFAEHGSHLAGVIVEPLCQGAAGMRIYETAFLERLYKKTREAGALFIADEVATGFGKTGSMFAFEQAGIDPDIVCLGKALSAGYTPISAAVAKDAVFETFSDEDEDHTFYHGHTYAGNPLAAAAALKAQELYTGLDLPRKAEALGQLTQNAWENLRDAPNVADIRRLGAICALEFTEYGGLTGPEHARRIQQKLLEKGILIRPLGAVLYVMPPLTTEPGLMEEKAAVIAEAVRS